MKILHVITSLRTGGAEKLMVDLLPKIRGKGAEVDLLIFDGKKTPFRVQLEKEGVKITHFGIECNVYNPLFVFRLIPIMRCYDVIHAHNTACQMFVAFANLFVRKRIITTEHSTSNRRRNHRWLLPLDKWMYHQFETIVTVSDISGQNIKNYIGDQRLITKTISNGIDVSKYREATICSELKDSSAGVHIAVMVAGFRYEKDQDTVIRAFSHLSEQYHLFLVGDGERRKLLEDLIESLNLQKRIHLLGIRSDIPNILKTADTIILSSHREGLSLSSLEGMASGKPFIASDVDGLHEIVSGYGILFPHSDEVALADAIRKCCENTIFACEIGRKCQERASQFDISKTADQYCDLYLSPLEKVGR